MTTTQEMLDAELVEVVSTGQPEVQLLACVWCGALLWDPVKHYKNGHSLR